MSGTRWVCNIASSLGGAAASLGLLGALAPGIADATPPVSDAAWLSVGDRTLASLRGGFRMGDGLSVSFGITRAVFVNGALVTETSLNVGGVAEITGAQATQISQKIGSISLLQNGLGNKFVLGPSSTITSTDTGPNVTILPGSTSGTFIQNSLNDQQIRYETLINASSNSLGMVRTLNLHNTLTEAIQQSIGQR